jgi:hypothetical protein
MTIASGSSNSGPSVEKLNPEVSNHQTCESARSQVLAALHKANLEGTLQSTLLHILEEKDESRIETPTSDLEHKFMRQEVLAALRKANLEGSLGDTLSQARDETKVVGSDSGGRSCDHELDNVRRQVMAAFHEATSEGSLASVLLDAHGGKNTSIIEVQTKELHQDSVRQQTQAEVHEADWEGTQQDILSHAHVEADGIGNDSPAGDMYDEQVFSAQDQVFSAQTTNEMYEEQAEKLLQQVFSAQERMVTADDNLAPTFSDDLGEKVVIASDSEWNVRKHVLSAMLKASEEGTLLPMLEDVLEKSSGLHEEASRQQVNSAMHKAEEEGKLQSAFALLSPSAGVPKEDNPVSNSSLAYDSDHDRPWQAPTAASKPALEDVLLPKGESIYEETNVSANNALGSIFDGEAARRQVWAAMLKASHEGTLLSKFVGVLKIQPVFTSNVVVKDYGTEAAQHKVFAAVLQQVRGETVQRTSSFESQQVCEEQTEEQHSFTPLADAALEPIPMASQEAEFAQEFKNSNEGMDNFAGVAEQDIADVSAAPKEAAPCSEEAPCISQESSPALQKDDVAELEMLRATSEVKESQQNCEASPAHQQLIQKSYCEVSQELVASLGVSTMDDEAGIVEPLDLDAAATHELDITEICKKSERAELSEPLSESMSQGDEQEKCGAGKSYVQDQQIEVAESQVQDLAVRTSRPPTYIALPQGSDSKTLSCLERPCSADSDCSNDSVTQENMAHVLRMLPISDLPALAEYKLFVARRSLVRCLFRHWTLAVSLGERETDSVALDFAARRGIRVSQRSLVPFEERRCSSLGAIAPHKSEWKHVSSNNPSNRKLASCDRMVPLCEQYSLAPDARQMQEKKPVQKPSELCAPVTELVVDDENAGENTDSDLGIDYGLRPWDKPRESGNIANHFLKHLNAVGREGGAEAIEFTLWADGKRGQMPGRKRVKLPKIPALRQKPSAEELAAREERRKEILANHLSAKNLHCKADASVWEPSVPAAMAKLSPRDIYLARLAEVEKPTDLSMKLHAAQVGNSRNARGKRPRPSSTPPELVSPTPPELVSPTGSLARAAALAECVHLPALTSDAERAVTHAKHEGQFPGLRAAPLYSRSVSVARSAISRDRRPQKCGSLPTIKVRHRGSPAEPPRMWRPPLHS